MHRNRRGANQWANLSFAPQWQLEESTGPLEQMQLDHLQQFAIRGHGCTADAHCSVCSRCGPFFAMAPDPDAHGIPPKVQLLGNGLGWLAVFDDSPDRLATQFR